MGRSFTPEQLRDFIPGSGQHQAALAIDAQEAQLEKQAEMAAQATGMGVTVAPTQPISVAAPNPLATPDPQPEADTQIQPEAKNAPEERSEPVEDVDYWRKKAEIAERRRKDSQQELTPVQMKASDLEREVKVLRAELDSTIAKMHEMAVDKPASHPVATDEVDELADYGQEFSNAITSKSAKTALKIVNEQNAELRKEIEQLKKLGSEFEAMRTRSQQEQQQSALRQHLAEVESVHKDALSYLHPDNLVQRPALIAWAEENETSYNAKWIAENPLMLSGHDVAKIITRFKRDTGQIQKKNASSSLTDKVIRANSQPIVPVQASGNPQGLLTDAEFSNFIQLLQKHTGNREKQFELAEAYDRTKLHKLKQSQLR